MSLTRCYKTTVFYIYICVFSTEFILNMCIIAQTYLRFCKKKQTNRSRIGILFLVSIFCELNHRRHSYDVIKVLKMAAIDVTNQLPVPI